MTAKSRRRGRVEVGLDNELATRDDIKQAARAALRAQAHAVDMAEAAKDPETLSTASRVYLELRHAEGLGPPAPVAEVDAFDRLLAELGRTPAGPRNTPDPGAPQPRG
jgi:hypothetical protein